MTLRSPPLRADIETSPFVDSPYLRVFLNGVEVRGVIRYDAEAGTLTKYARDPVTDRLILKPGGHSVQTETLQGFVEARWVDGYQPGPVRS